MKNRQKIGVQSFFAFFHYFFRFLVILIQFWVPNGGSKHVPSCFLQLEARALVFFAVRSTCPRVFCSSKHVPSCFSSQMDCIHFLGGVREGPSGLLKIYNISVHFFSLKSNHAWGRTPAHCDASRISAGVLFRNCVVALLKFFNAVVRLCCSSSQILRSRPWILLRIRNVLSNNDERATQ